MSGDAQVDKRAAESQRMRELLDDWKQLLVHAKRVVDWEEAFHPGVIFGVVSALFLIIWYVEPTFLSFLSLVALFITVADYLLPLILPRLLPIDAWNQEDQQRYDAVCEAIVGAKYESRALFFRAQAMKAEKPRLYLALTSVALLLLAWIGSALGDLTLLYLLTLGAALYPGAVQNPAIEAHLNVVVDKVKGLLNKEKTN